MLTDLSASTECEVDKVDSAGMNDGKGLGTALGIRTCVGRVMAELEDMARLLERRLLEERPVPFLCLLTSQNHAKNICDNHRLTSIVWKGLKE